jgi:hypothetical protein
MPTPSKMINSGIPEMIPNFFENAPMIKSKPDKENAAERINPTQRKIDSCFLKIQ